MERELTQGLVNKLIQMSQLKPTYTPEHNLSEGFGNTSRLVLGTSGLGGVWGGIDLKESVEAILYALDNGISVFDTAPSYAEAEQVLGQALKQWRGARPFISTKVGRLKANDAHTTITDYSTDGITKSLHRSLDLLGQEHVDLLFLHEPQLVSAKEIPRILDLMISFKEKGLTRMIGIGGNMTTDFMPFMGSEKFEVVSGFLNMNACRLDAFHHDVGFFKAKAIKYYNASILHFGLLGTRLESYRSNIEQETWLKQEDLDNADKLLSLANEQGMPLANLAFRYALAIKEADRIVIGAKNMRQIQDALKDWKEGPISKELFEAITHSTMHGVNSKNFIEM
jgi:aryl-alcohol dehydrogenase-like predicted oxidoreductase